MKKLRITVEGKAYDVTVEVIEDSVPSGQVAPMARPVTSALTAPVSSTSQSAQPTPAGEGVIASPLSGKVVAVAATPGKRVAKGEELVTIEAMKMNTFVYAPSDGIVEEVLVAAGDAVEEGRALLKMKAG
ncbi:MAG: biotin/lipoyl-binding protein [Candidatus Methylacidiphilales bacterium]